MRWFGVFGGRGKEAAELGWMGFGPKKRSVCGFTGILPPMKINFGLCSPLFLRNRACPALDAGTLTCSYCLFWFVKCTWQKYLPVWASSLAPHGSVYPLVVHTSFEVLANIRFRKHPFSDFLDEKAVLRNLSFCFLLVLF